MIPKFRAWDTLGKGYINGFNMIGFSTGQGAPNRHLQRYSQIWREPDSYILEQSTGLKDKSGKEIYEGDILGRKGFKRIIEWNEYECRFQAAYPDSSGIHLFTKKELATFEIIGTIHDTEAE